MTGSDPYRQDAPEPDGVSVLAGLIERVAGGDRDAFAGLYDATAGQLFRLALRRVGDRASAEAALHETFLEVWRQARRFRSQEDPGAWLLQWMPAIGRQGAAPPTPSRIEPVVERPLPHQTHFRREA